MNEGAAIQAYEKYKEVSVITSCGAIISKLNPWLSYTPDGILMKNGKPHTLIEVKCPFAGKKKCITDIIEKIKFLKVVGNSIEFKRNHEYFCQIQLGMAILNVSSTDFIVYASYDASFMIINILYEEQYILNVLSTVKQIYSHMLHFECKKDNQINENA